MSQEQVPTQGKKPVETPDQSGGRLAAEVDRHVPADDQVDLAGTERRFIGDEILQPELHEIAHRLGDGVAPVRARVEPALHGAGLSELDRPSGVDAGASDIQCRSRDIGPNDPNREGAGLFKELHQQHGERVWLLARRTAGRPDRQRPP